MGVEETVSPHPQGRVSPIRPAPPPSPDLVEVAERAFQTVLGLVSLMAGSVTAVVTEAIRGEVHELPDEPQPDDDESWPKPLAPILAGAALGVAIESARVGSRAASAFGRSLRPWISFATSPKVVRGWLDRIGERVNEFDDRWRQEQEKDERLGSSFAGVVVPQIVDATLGQLDLTELVLARVDLDRIVDAVDLERAVSRVDLEAIVSGINVDAIVAQVDVEAIVARIDLDRIVATVDIERVVERVDLDSVAARLNVEAIVRRLDLAAIAREVIGQLDLASIATDVIDEIDLPQIVRESTGSMANETVEGVRVQSMSADRAVSRLVDRLLGREGERDESKDHA